MMISCKQAMDLASKALDTRLSRKERMMLRLHVWFCRGCQRYQQQLEWIHQLCHRLDPESWLPKVTLSEEARRRILQRLRRDS